MLDKNQTFMRMFFMSKGVQEAGLSARSTSAQICLKAITENQSNHIEQLLIISIPASIEKNSNVI